MPAAPKKKQGSAPDAGKRAPELDLVTDEGKPFRLSSLRGRDVVLFFFPKADTPG